MKTFHIGEVILLPDNIDTDIIIPTEYMALPSLEEMAKYAFFPLRPDIPSNVKQGSILVAGRNFGCGSSREQAVEVLKILGFFCVIAESFSRLFYRNAINNGLPVFEVKGISTRVKERETLKIDLKNVTIYLDKKIIGKFKRFPERLEKILDMGGLVNYYKNINILNKR